MRRIVQTASAGVKSDWSMVLAATVGLTVLVLSFVSTETITPSNRVSGDGGADVHGSGANHPNVVRTETENGYIWAYNAQNQLIDIQTGSLLPMRGAEDETGTMIGYFNQRGQKVTAQGILID